jgi:Haem-NO-binding
MYGLINKAVEELVTTRFGAEAWRQILAKSGVDEPSFVTMKKYPDEITYSLVGAASELLKVPAEILLEEFGEYWTVYSAQAGFGHLLAFAGDNIVEFLQNLDNMHTRVALVFPELEPPSFRVSAVTPTGLRLHYRSPRPGLAPVVIGMVRGLGKRFGTPVSIRLDKPRADLAGYDEFVVTYETGVAAAA